MSQQSDKARASVTSLTPEPEEIKYSKSGVPLHMLDSIQIQELPADELPEMGLSLIHI